MRENEHQDEELIDIGTISTDTHGEALVKQDVGVGGQIFFAGIVTE